VVAKKNPMQMVMKQHDIDYRVRMLERWGHQCIVCGLEFANLACVSKEHVIPKSKLHQILGFPKNSPLLHQAIQELRDNKAPSHYQCNQLRGTRSLIEACREVERMKTKMSPQTFVDWLNKKIPNRKVPPAALEPLRKRGCLELPEYLPGMQ